MKYQYKIDRKVTMWERTHVEIEADTQEEADRLAIKEGEPYNYGEEGTYVEILEESMEYLEPWENKNEYTKEVIRGDDTIYTNIESVGLK